MKRNTQLDGLRGLLLVIMLIDHFHGPLKKLTYEAFGFVTAAEGFVFISGLVAGLIYSKKASITGMVSINSAATSRSWVLYKYHIMLFLLLLVSSLNISSLGTFWAQKVPLFFDNPLLAVSLGSTFLYQPSHFDILPMYCIFMLLIPEVIRAFINRKYFVVFSISFVLYFVGQLQTIGILENVIQNYVPVSFGGFDMFAWQILFLLGLSIGFLEFKLNKKWLIIKSNSIAFVCCSIFVVFAILLRHKIFQINLPYFDYLVSKTTLGAFRLLNLLALAYIFNYLISIIKINLFSYSWLILLGKHSLQVYSFHIVLIIFLFPVNEYIKTMGLPIELIFTALIVSSLTIPAFLHQRYRDIKGRSSVLV